MPDEPGLLPVIQSHRRQETGDTPNKLTSYQHMVSSDFKLVASNLGKYLASTSDYTCTYIQMHTHHVFRPMPKKISVSYLFNCRDRFWIHRKKRIVYVMIITVTCKFRFHQLLQVIWATINTYYLFLHHFLNIQFFISLISQYHSDEWRLVSRFFQTSSLNYSKLQSQRYF